MKDDLKTGKVYWVTGLAGAGKTTIGKMLYNALKNQKPNVVFLDGDILREVFGTQGSYSLLDRKNLAMIYAKMCRMLAAQGVDVVCCTISMFDEVRDWNRLNIGNYIEIYIKVPLKSLIERDQKGIYSKSMNGELKNVMGLDLTFEEPKSPDIIVENDGNLEPDIVFSKLMKKIDSLNQYILQINRN